MYNVVVVTWAHGHAANAGRYVMTGVEKHYSDSESLVDAIAASLRAVGIDPERVSTTDLAAVDEFHIRGRTATVELADAMGVNADTSVHGDDERRIHH